MDVSQQEQLVDIVAVRRVEEIAPEESDDIPDIYWEVFENFNKYNLISFKSYSESFNGFSLMEFYGHFVNYCKTNDYKQTDVNLYAIVNHYPQYLLGPLKGTPFLIEVKEKQVYDLCLTTMHPVRFIICTETDNPILALFSGKQEKVLANYQRILQETTLFDKLSGYFNVFLEFFGEVITDMYTLEDFKRDYPPRVLPTLPEDLGGELWGVVMERLLLERVTKQAQAEVQAEAQAEAERVQAEAQATLQTELKEREIEMMFNVLNHRYGSVILADEWQSRLARCTLDHLRTLSNQAWEVDSVETFVRVIEELPDPDTLQMDESCDEEVQTELAL